MESTLEDIQAVIVPQRAILKAGKWNGKSYSLAEVRKAFENFSEPVTKDTSPRYKNRNSLVLDHNDGVFTWVGDVMNPVWDEILGGFRADLRIVDKGIGEKVEFQLAREKATGQPPAWGLSPRLDADVVGDAATNIRIKNVALVLEPAQGNEMFLSLEKGDPAPLIQDDEGTDSIDLDFTIIEQEEQEMELKEIQAEVAGLKETVMALQAEATKAAEAKKLADEAAPVYQYRKPEGEFYAHPTHGTAYYPARLGKMEGEARAALVADLNTLGKELMACKDENLEAMLAKVIDLMGSIPGMMLPVAESDEEMAKATAAKLAADAKAKELADAEAAKKLAEEKRLADEAAAKAEAEKKAADDAALKAKDVQLSRKGLVEGANGTGLNVPPEDKIDSILKKCFDNNLL